MPVAVKWRQEHRLIMAHVSGDIADDEVAEGARAIERLVSGGVRPARVWIDLSTLSRCAALEAPAAQPVSPQRRGLPRWLKR